MARSRTEIKSRRSSAQPRGSQENIVQSLAEVCVTAIVTE